MSMSPALRLAVGLGALTIIRLLLIGQTNLIPDEAYYFFWADKLEACYWDQPAGVAVVGKLALWLFHKSVFGVRLMAVGLSLIASLAAYDLGKTCLGSPIKAAHGALLTQIQPLLGLGAVLMLHDTVMAAACMVALAFAARAVVNDKPVWWYAAGIAGTAALYAKFSAILLAPCLVVFFILSSKSRRHLLRPEPYLASFMAAVLFSPVILWNMRNGWVAYYAVSKLSGNSGMSIFERMVSPFDFLGSQILLATPILFALIALALFDVWKKRRHESMEGRIFLASVTAGIIGYFFVQAFRAKVQGNWAALAYIPGSLLAVDYIADRWSRRRVRTWSLAGIALAAIATLCIHVHAIRPFIPLPAGVDMSAQAHGWEELSGEVKGHLKNYGSGAAVMARRYQVASELEFYLGPEVDVYCASYASRGSQYDIWQNYDELIGRDVVYVDYQGEARKLFLHFGEWEMLGQSHLGYAGRKTKPVNVFGLRSFKTKGPLEAYFADPFGDSLARLKYRIKAGGK
jgi:4-amino-4-deoxy-L-arabinose transferase-like glycosyltransferase